MARKKMMVVICDNPDCDSEITEQIDRSEDMDPPTGFTLGKGSYSQDWGGGPLPALFACSTACIVPAIENAIYAERNAS
ncbi:hypothetical protein HOT31_gp101 [Microbacterium phage Hendrix]|uniref:Uncharacterized protein n=1 Tax=Microbacterium phage Hendrix TaxID=2182341 RepID=A0A2U8UUM9_9CAUD|nr:hypothetical protein HOT31_gp101 [Microbacterium phage Hendrix]AWN07772.1 hypothetical protein PBI_HENDRIX_101 [Microbacterium phage Hendrix]